MKYLKHFLKLHVQYLSKYSYTRYTHPLLKRTRSPKYKLKAKETPAGEYVKTSQAPLFGIHVTRCPKFNLSPSRSMWFCWVEYNADLTSMTIKKPRSLIVDQPFPHSHKDSSSIEEKMFSKVTLPSTLIFSAKDVCTINLTVSCYLYLYSKPCERCYEIVT